MEDSDSLEDRMDFPRPLSVSEANERREALRQDGVYDLNWYRPIMGVDDIYRKSFRPEEIEILPFKWLSKLYHRFFG